MTLHIDFLAHTRSGYSDYIWIYGLRDVSRQKDLESFLLKWLGAGQLDKLPPVSVFFCYKNYAIIMIARVSRSRIDSTKRPIFERALYLWDQGESVRYRSIRSLHRRLEKQADEVFSSVPEEVRLTREFFSFDVSIEELDDEDVACADLSQNSWSLPCNLEEGQFLRSNWTVQAPPEWSFGRLLEPILATETCPKPVSVGSGLPLALRFDKSTCWIISPPGNDSPASEPCLLDNEGRAISSIDVNLQEKEATVLRGVPAAPIEQDSSLSSTPPVGELQRLFGDAIERSGEMAERTSGWFPWSRDREVAKAVMRISQLVAPIGMGLGLDHLVLWNSLLNEILLLNVGSANEIRKEWIRRLHWLEQTSVDDVSFPQVWSGELKRACLNLESMLKKRG